MGADNTVAELFFPLPQVVTEAGLVVVEAGRDLSAADAEPFEAVVVRDNGFRRWVLIFMALLLRIPMG